MKIIEAPDGAVVETAPCFSDTLFAAAYTAVLQAPVMAAGYLTGDHGMAAAMAMSALLTIPEIQGVGEWLGDHHESEAVTKFKIDTAAHLSSWFLLRDCFSLMSGDETVAQQFAGGLLHLLESAFPKGDFSMMCTNVESTVWGVTLLFGLLGASYVFQQYGRRNFVYLANLAGWMNEKFKK